MDYEEATNYTNTTDLSPSSSLKYIIPEVIFCIFCIVGICADSLIIYTHLKFQRLRSSTNMFLVNWAIADLCSLIVTPSGYKIVSIIDHLTVSRTFMCVLLEIGSVMHVTVLIFVIITAFDWTFACYFRKPHLFVKKYYKYIIAAVWFFSLLMGSVQTGLCLNAGFYYSGFGLLLLGCLYCAALLLVIILQLSVMIKKCRRRPIEHSTFMLTLASAFVITWLLSFFNFLLIIFFTSQLFYLLILSECLMFSNSIVNFNLLYFYNQEFKACLRQVVKCTNNKYRESSMNFENPIVHTNGKSSVQINFNNAEEELLPNDYSNF